MSRQLRVLLRKELRQFLRSRTAVLTGLLLPTLIMVVVPLVQLGAAGAGSAARTSDGIPAAVPGLVGLSQLNDFFLYFTFPWFYVLGGLMTPALAASHTIISERERRSIELLVALPVSVRDILTAKLGANLLVAGVTLVPLFAIDAGAVLRYTNAGLPYVAAALLLVLSAMAASIGISLLMALLARDFRTANNLNGVFVVPTMLLTGLCVTLVPGLWRFVVLSMLMLALGGLAYVIAVRWLTFERYLT